MVAHSTLLIDLVATSQHVGEHASRRKKIAHMAEFLRRLEPAEIGIAVSYLSGLTRQGKTGVGWTLIRDARESATHVAVPELTLTEVDAALEQIAHATGPGSTAQRSKLLGSLLARATPDEQEY